MSRIEGLSDAVFGFVITLLVVSLEVPRTSTAMLDTLRGVPIFALTFTVLLAIWHAQYVFFRRYGLDDNANGLKDEKGLSFDLDGDSVIIRLTIEKPGVDGTSIVKEHQARVTCRN